MNELIDLIFEETLSNTSPLVHAGVITRSGVLRENTETGLVEELTPTAITTPIMESKAFDKMLRQNPPIKDNILMINDRKGNRILFCDLDNPKLVSKVRVNTTLFTLLDRVVQYMILNGVDSAIFDKDGAYARSWEGDKLLIERDPVLEKYNKVSTLKSIRDDTLIYADLSLSQEDTEIDLSVIVQGVPVKVMYWKDLAGKVEMSVGIEHTKVRAFGKVGEVFKASGGFLVVARNLAQDIPHLISGKTHKRVAYKGFGTLAIREPDVTCSYFGSETPMESLRGKSYDVFVINIERMSDYKEILALPTNKLCILVYDFTTVNKSINILKTLFREDTVIRTHITDNLLGIVSGTRKDEFVILDDWSRDMLGYENDVGRIVDKLGEPFFIRDDLNITQEVDIKKEIEMVFIRAGEVKASNIDICPGAPIRLYQTKTQYVDYSQFKMTPNLVEIMLLNMIPASEMTKLYESGELDTSYSIPGVGRYRLGVVAQRSSYAVSVRGVPTVIPAPELLNLPSNFVEDVAKQNKGFTMIVGEPNSGKTVTFNCLIDKINEDVGGIVFLMGSPIEYTHRHKKALVIQVEVGKDIATYTQGIAKSLRMNTSTLGFEELRTQEEFTALGALINAPNSIFMTMHAPSCKKAVEGLVERLSETGISTKKAQEDVANALNYIIYQKLVDYGGNRVLIYEKLKATRTVKNLIRQGNFNQLDNVMASEEGCETLDQVIMRRLEDRMLDVESAKPHMRDERLFASRGYFE